MSYLLDTDVTSEWAKPQPNPKVVEWLGETLEHELHISVVSWAELRRGVERLAPGKRRQPLAEWLENELAHRFGARILPVDPAVADAWGILMARREGAGRPAALHGRVHCRYRGGSWADARHTQCFGFYGIGEIDPEPVDSGLRGQPVSGLSCGASAESRSNPIPSEQ